MDDKTLEASKKRKERLKGDVDRLRELRDSLTKQSEQLEAERDHFQDLTIAYKVESSEIEETLKKSQGERNALKILNKELKSFNEEVSTSVKRQKIQIELFKNACLGPLWDSEAPEDDEVFELVEAQLKTYDMQGSFIERAAEMAFKAYGEEIQLINLSTRRLAKDLEEMREGRRKDMAELQSRRRAVSPDKGRQVKSSRGAIERTVSL
mmetsp:Transcript_26639/g.47924  ORF Transcript_26639/g.47924 Transcript_26639/m.47924 type:complete len:209 (+) Transcript_26639:1783-2409(+)